MSHNGEDSLGGILDDAFSRMCAIQDQGEKGRTMQFLSFMCSCPDNGLLLKALKAAADMSCEASDADRQLMVDQGGTGHLINLCKQRNAEPEVVANVVLILANLSLTRMNRPQIVCDGAIPCLINLCETAQDKSIIANAAQTLANLAVDDDCRRRITSEGAINVLCKICTDMNGNFSPQVDGPILGNVSAALCNLAQEPDGRAQILQCGVLKVLVQLCSTVGCDYRSLRYAAGTIANLTLQQSEMQQLLDAGVLPLLVTFCHTKSDTKVLANTVAALHNLSRHENARLQVLEHQVVAALCQLAGRCDDTHVLGFAAGVIANLGLHEASIPVLLEEGAVTFLVAYCSSTSSGPLGGKRRGGKAASPTLLAHASLALKHLARHKSSRLQIIQEGAIPALVQLCQDYEDYGRGGGGSGSGSGGGTGSGSGTGAGGGSHQASGAGRNEHINPPGKVDEIVANAAGALANLALHEEGRPQIVHERGLPTLVTLYALCDDPLLRRYHC
jgi:uncharacterized membrane protein YgcG